MRDIKSKFDLSGKVAIITGSSKGIGKSVAWGLVENGAKVVVSSRKQEAVDTVAKELNADGLEAVGIQCHIGDTDQRQLFVSKTIYRYGRIDILGNNAAINPYYGPLEESEEQVFDKIMEIKASSSLKTVAHGFMLASGFFNGCRPQWAASRPFHIVCSQWGSPVFCRRLPCSGQRECHRSARNLPSRHPRY